MEINSARGIPGFTSMYQHPLYNEVARKLPKNPRFLEIGTSLGRSTWAWLDVLPSDTMYDVVDTFNIDNTELPDFERITRTPPPGPFLDCWYFILDKLNYMSHYALWNYILEHHPKYSLFNNVIAINIRQYIKNEYRSKYDAIFIDAEHTYESVIHMLEYFKESTIICGDDYKNPAWPGVEKAVKEFAKKYNFRLTEYDKNLFYILEKQ